MSAAFALMCALRKLTAIDKNVVSAMGRMVLDTESDSNWKHDEGLSNSVSGR